jgi:hypothetical protein
MMLGSHTADSRVARNLYNFLQDLVWVQSHEGSVFRITALGKHGLLDEALHFFFSISTTVIMGESTENVGDGHGPSYEAAKRKASVQALEYYLRSQGKGSWWNDRYSLTLILLLDSRKHSGACTEGALTWVHSSKSMEWSTAQM